MKVPFVDLRAQHDEVRDEIREAIEQAVGASAFVGGPAVQKFEEDFAAYCGARFAIGVGSGTDALCLALKALGVEPGQGVITVPNTFIATAEAITLVGARPIFVDVDPNTYTLDPQALRSYLETACAKDPTSGRPVDKSTGDAITAITPVHLYGFPADMDAIGEIAEQYNLNVVEDACQAHGATYSSTHGHPARTKVGTIGRLGCFSFYPSKNLGAMGEGGAVITNDAALAERIRCLRNHGQTERYVHERPDGSNCRLDAIQAAILDIKLKKLDEWNARRQRAAALYVDGLQGSRVTAPRTRPHGEHVYHLFVVQVEDRDRVRRELDERGIETALHYPIPLHCQEAYQHLGLPRGSFPIAEAVADKLVSLPMYPHLQAEQIAYVCETLRETVG